MRFLEVLLSIVNPLALLSLIVPLPVTLRWLRLLSLLAPLIAIVQITVEGARWQMLPAYLLAIVFGGIGVLSVALPMEVQVNQWLIRAGVVLGVAITLAAVFLPILFPVFHFPRPAGPYAIGTLTYHWVDAKRPELFTTNPDDHRELVAQIWYPAQDDPSAVRAPYIPDADRVTPALARQIRLPEFLFTHFKFVRTNAVASAPVASDQSRYPVLIFLSGLGGFRQVNTFQIEALVSQGYIVVGLDQPGAVALTHFPDGREIAGLPRAELHALVLQSVEPLPATPTLMGNAMPDGIVPYFAADVSFTLDQLAALNDADPNQLLTGRLDLDRAGVFGVSLGGINAGEACLNDLRLKACLIMDVYMSAHVVESGLQQPAMWITRGPETMRFERERAGGWPEKEIELHHQTMRAVYDRLLDDGYILQIPDMFHLNLTDVPYWSPLFQQLGLTGPLNGQRIFDIVNAYSVAFFDKYLQDRPTPLLDAPSGQFPEVIFETRRASLNP